MDEGEVERLTLRFRNRMSKLHLATPGAQPGVAPATSFVDLVAQAGKGRNPILEFVTGLLTAAWPAQAYEVHATLIRREQEPPFGVSVQVVLQPNLAIPPHSCWAPTWDAVVDRAANFAAAFILPRSSPGRRPPWAAWQGTAMPPHLLDDYERASELCHHRRYDEALAAFYSALATDPKNVDIRLKIGFIQEKLGLAMEALDTYHGIAELTTTCDRPRSRAIVDWHLRRAEDRSVLLAKYRRGVLLGEGERLAHQWNEKGKGPTSAPERDELRSRLCLACPELEGASQKSFQRLGVKVLDEVLGEIPRSLFRHEDESLTRTAVRLSKKCVCVRLDGRDAISGEGLDTALKESVDQIRRTSRLLGRIAWAERYNAASLYALGARFGTPNDEENRELRGLAVKELELAVQRAKSGYVASRREWLLSEDPDLDSLRSAPHFKAFEATYFPPVKSLLTRPYNLHQLEAAEYVRRLLSVTADRRSKLWGDRVNQRARRDPEWWAEDDHAWDLVGAVATDCHRWQTRLEFINGINAWMAAYGWRDVPLGYPEFADFHSATWPLIENLEAQLAGAVESARNATRDTCSDRGAAWGALSEKLSPPCS